MSSQPQQSRKRVVHQLDTPFSTIEWPEIAPEEQDTILELLCSLLSPVGQHRQAYIQPSKGKRTAKKEERAKRARRPSEKPTVPPVPEISKSVDVGLNSITRRLEALSFNGDGPYSMVFVARGNQASPFNCHFPQMIAAASRKHASMSGIRLVGFSKPCSERLSACLGVPRVSSVAILKDAPGAQALQDLVQKVVEPVTAVWMDEAQQAQYLATSINAIETTIGPKRAKAAA